MTHLWELHEAIAVLCPIDGVSGDIDDPSTWRIQYRDEASAKQRKAAEAKLKELQS